MRRTGPIPCLIALFLLESTGTVTAQTADTAALEAARRRQQFARTWDIHFSLNEWLAKGAQTDFTPRGSLKPNHPVPEREMTLSSTNRAACDGNKIRIEYNHPQWLMPQGILRKPTSLGVFDGELSKDFYPKTESGPEPTEGTIQLGPPWFANNPDLIPIVYTFRPLNNNLTHGLLANLKSTGLSLPIDGKKCYEFALRNPGATTSYWLDADKDYVVRRIAHRNGGRLESQMDISYRQPGKGEPWVPFSWISNSFAHNGSLLISKKGKVGEVHINEPIASDEFEFRFPPGTIVMDNRAKGMWYRVDSDGTMREIDPFTLKPVSWISTGQPGDPWYRVHRWLLLFSLMVPAALWLIWHRRVIRKRLA